MRANRLNLEAESRAALLTNVNMDTGREEPDTTSHEITLL